MKKKHSMVIMPSKTRNLNSIVNIVFEITSNLTNFKVTFKYQNLAVLN